MAINKQITICKSATEFIVYPESKNEIGLMGCAYTLLYYIEL